MSEEKAEDTSMPSKHTYTVPVRFVLRGKRAPLPYDFDDASTPEHPDVTAESNTTGRAAQGDVREALASYAHEAWAGWMRYFFDQCIVDPMIGVVCVPPEYESNLVRLMNTTYANLPEEQKDNDRAEADKMLALLGEGRG